MGGLILIKVTIPHLAFLADKHPVQIIADHLQKAGVKWTSHSMWMASPEIYTQSEQVAQFTMSLNAAGFTEWQHWEDSQGRHYQLTTKQERMQRFINEPANNEK
jgi:hypothetical protein